MCKTNTIPILMHQMRISTNQVSSVVLRPKNLEIRKIVKSVKSYKEVSSHLSIAACFQCGLNILLNFKSTLLIYKFILSANMFVNFVLNIFSGTISIFELCQQKARLGPCLHMGNFCLFVCLFVYHFSPYSTLFQL
jgi:hypothetical protein